MNRPKLPKKPGNSMTVQFTSVDQALRKAKALSKRGAVGEAQTAYRWVLENFPNNKRALDGLQTLGASANRGKTGLTQEQANALIVLHRQGRTAEALEQALKLVLLRADVAFLQNFIGVCHTALGQANEAVPRYMRALALTPEAADVHANLGDALNALNSPKEAVASFRRAIELNPALPNVHNNMGSALMKLGDVQGASESFGRAAEVDPGNVDAHANLGLALIKLGKLQEGADACRRAIEVNPRFALAHVNLAHAHDATGETGEAIECLEKAIALQPNHIAAHSNLCEILDRLNRTEDMRAAVTRAREHCNTNDPRILFRTAQLAARDKDHATARGLLERMPESGLTQAMTMGRLTLLGKTCDKLDDHAAAFGYFAAANRLTKTMPATESCDPARYRTRIAEMSDSFGAGGAVDRTGGSESGNRPAPVFMIGFPRSGTTLLDTILRSHPDITVIEEKPMVAGMREMLGGLPDRERLAALTDTEIAALRDAYFAELDKHLDSETAPRIVIDKLPLNIINAGLIKRVFPSAKFILSLRHPADCVLSCFMQNFKLNDAMANFLDIEDSARLYDGVMTLWGAYEEALRPEVHTVRYEELVEDMEGVAAGLLDFLGLDWSDNLRNYRETALSRGRINTPSYNQVTEKLYTQARGRWENYKPQLAPVLPLLEPWAERFGYGK